MIVTPKIEHLQMIITEIKQMTLRLYLNSFVISFTSGFAVYNYIFSTNIMLVSCILHTRIRRTNYKGVDPEFSQNI